MVIDMKRIMDVIRKSQSYIFCMAIVLLFLVICIPLCVVAKYNYMSADDFGYGVITHHAIMEGQPLKIFGLAAKQAADTYMRWQGSFSAVFIFALQPGIWGEQYYQLGIYFILFCMFFLQFAFFQRIAGKGREKVPLHIIISLCALLNLVQVLWAPYPEECFYWMNGGLYYTFFYTLQVLLFSEILVFFRFPAKLKGAQWLFFGWMLLFAVIIGGGNLATGLATALVLGLLTVWQFVKKANHRFYLLAIMIIYLIAFGINIISPGNAVRAQDPGYHKMNPISAVLLAMWHCMLNIYSWTDYKMLLILLIAVPLLWKIAGAVIQNWKFTFRFPAIATVFLFGIYASQLAPITYMEGSFGPKRMGDMMWFSYMLWIFCTEGYWIGWFRNKYADKKQPLILKYGGILQLCILALWCVLVLMTNVRNSSTYLAWAALRSGEAQAYAAENEERLEILKNPEIKDVWLDRIQHPIEPIYSTDITNNNQNYSNRAMADFYYKNTVNLIED